MMALHLGIDEAGRGSVLGSLVVCGCVVREERIPRLAAIGLADSKELSPERRTELAAKIRGLADRLIVRRLSPQRVDEAVAGGGLNAAEITEMLIIIRAAEPKVVYIDALTSRPEKFGRQVRALLEPRAPEIVAENKADTRYPLVQAAAIVAKVTRDAEITRLKRTYGETGSGYPSDPRTKKFLMRVERMRLSGAWPSCVRKSWQTVKRFE